MIKFQQIEADGTISDFNNPLLCSFGIITPFLVGALTSALTSAGVGEATAGILGGIGAGAIEGGAVGAITDPRAPLKGLESGAISGGVASGLAPVIGSTLGTGTTLSDALGGVIGGGIGAAVTGQPVGTGAITGGLGGAVQGALSTPGAVSGTAPPTGGPGPSAASAAAPASVPTAAATPAEGLSDVANLGGPELGGGGGVSPVSSALGGPELGPASTGAVAPGSALTTPSGISSAVTPASATSPTTPTASVGATPATTGATPAQSSSGIGGFLKDNSWLLPAGALAASALQSQRKLPGEAALSTDAANLSRQAGQLQNYFTSGTLPPGLQSGIDRASASAKAAIRSKYASIGNTGSSAESQDLANVDNVAVTQGSQIALSLLQQGVSEQGMADQLYQQIMSNALQQDQQLGSALGAFSAALVPSAIKQAA